MSINILIISVIIMFCVLLNKFSHKIGIPMLLFFIILGMIFGNDGLFRIPFENYYISEQICSIALIFIMFYGGFGTNWKQAKPIVIQAGMLSTLGVVITAALVGLFCYVMLSIGFLESLLIGAVISSTDAASVFSILRSKKLGLKERTDSLLEVESGSNDPSSYMLTIVALSAMHGTLQYDQLLMMILLQLLFGVLIGLLVAYLASYILRKYQFDTAGFDMAFVVGVACFSYGLANLVGGNGYLSVYICGLVLGNIRIKNKKALVHFFDGITGLMQMLIFFLLGLLATPSRIPSIFLAAFSIMVFLTFIARPVAVFAILTPYKCSLKQRYLVSFAGLRGAASIVFAIMAVVDQSILYNDVYHIVFCIVLLSISFQGYLLPYLAKRLNMSDGTKDIMKTFSDYSDELDLNFIEINMCQGHEWVDKKIEDIIMPPDTLFIMIIRGKSSFVPNGSTIINEKDSVVLTAPPFYSHRFISLHEYRVQTHSKWIGKQIVEFSVNSDELVIVIIREDKTLIPNGDTVIEDGDVLIMNTIAFDKLV